MAYWDSINRKIVYSPHEEIQDYPYWVKKDCGCCGGTEWGGASPVECRRCRGNGYVCEHRPTGLTALYPGGPFVER
jgi:DnaJ-class molecular chaperone